MASGAQNQDSNAPPTSYPQTSPPTVAGESAWVLTAINKMEGTLGRIEATLTTVQSQVTSVETKLDKIKETVSGHEKWVHTLKVAFWGIGLIASWTVVYVVGPWFLKQISGK